MKEVKIYTIVSDQLSPPITGESFCTDMVRHSDYADLEEKFAALVAENATLKNPDNWLSQSDYGYEAAEVAAQNGATNDESLRAGMIAIINRIETPATDAFLAEVWASGVDAAIEHLHKKFGGTGHIGVPIMELEWLAQEIRKGGAA
ncbi:hypothetical protein YJ90_000927 [Salmonella enterica subsp. enterica]|nr:hypothetical protein [Salmonella enterica subsp. enterica serovar Bareilly]ECC3285251.1 hypothetical protein [Salmonella enterica subsp. enterica serovar Bareilly]EDQ2452170.1 hypothetical protein [Salmonella enterica subsp. enterica serovar Bareilly]EEJ6471346.1 hypothetical protein [Salmonella enterica subsp. enterica serovar Bareilly]EKC9877356.1 hypothetical protein [Salmonella enterica subsp. enterica serovar Braenderup]